MNVTTFLMFAGEAEEAMKTYAEIFPNARIADIERYAAREQGPEGTVKRSLFELNGMKLMFFDSPVKHAFTFTPAISLFVDCDDEPQCTRFFEQLSAGGQVLMPPNNYGFSKWFTWVQDRFGVSWQLNVP